MIHTPNMSTPINSMVDEFFKADRVSASTHEEWLLRTCSQLMEREAVAVANLERQASHQNRSTQSMPPSCPRTTQTQASFSNDSDAFTKPCTGTGTTSWGES